MRNEEFAERKETIRDPKNWSLRLASAIVRLPPDFRL